MEREKKMFFLWQGQNQFVHFGGPKINRKHFLISNFEFFPIIFLWIKKKVLANFQKANYRVPVIFWKENFAAHALHTPAAKFADFWEFDSYK